MNLETSHPALATAEPEALLRADPALEGTAGEQLSAGNLLIACSLLAAFVVALSGEWTLNPQYSFGWGVPILGTVLLFRRWNERPKIAPRGGSTVLFLIFVLFALWLPLRLLREANMDWRFLEWIIAGGAVTGLLLVAWRLGGRALATHLSFPLLFLMLAVPWPTRMESVIVQELSGIVVRLAVEALRWTGIAAWAAGNTIQMPGTALGVEDACSGIRSLQGALVCALFFGELFRLPLLRRIVLLVSGAGIAIAANLIRTFFLALTTFRRGEAVAGTWHDDAGLITLGICLALLWVAARAMRSENDEPRKNRRSVSLTGKLWPAFATIAAWICVVESIVLLWYRGSTSQPDLRRWHVASGAGFKRLPIPDRTQSILRYNSGDLLFAEKPDGTRWWIYSLRWDEHGIGTPLARFHSPEVCFPAAGFRPLEPGRPFQAGPAPETLFRTATYEWLGKPVYVFFQFRSQGNIPAILRSDEFDLTWRKRISLAARGIRPGAQEVLQIIITGAGSRAEAEQAVREFVRDSLRT